MEIEKAIEIWKPVVGFEGMYEVSDQGRIRSLSRTVIRKGGRKRAYVGTVLRMKVDNRGYLRTELMRKTVKVHRVVAEAFISKPDGCYEVNHKDGNKFNNRVGNLEWTDRKGNMRHAFRTGLMENRAAKMTPERVKQLKSEYVPYSRTNGTNALAKKYGVSAPYVWRILNGTKRKQVAVV